MKEKPNLPDQLIIDELREAYGVEIARLEFLSIGDISSAKYRVVTHEGAAYFLKLRSGEFKEISVTVPNYLHAHGIRQALSPMKTQDDRLWTHLGGCTCILYPYIDGQNGFRTQLSDRQWHELGAALQAVHSTYLPAEMEAQVPVDTYSPELRERMKGFLEDAELCSYEDPVAVKVAAGLREHEDEICFVLGRAEELGKALQRQPLERVLCHADIHAGNLLLEADGALHIIDWDDPVLAPKERDLMFIGGGMGGIWNTAREEALFYQGYGKRDINQAALAYYRYERLVSDMAEFCQQILRTTAGGADRERSLEKYYSIFLPNQTLELAHQTDRDLNGG